jgi:hypothetical protein
MEYGRSSTVFGSHIAGHIHIVPYLLASVGDTKAKAGHVLGEDERFKALEHNAGSPAVTEHFDQHGWIHTCFRRTGSGFREDSGEAELYEVV